MSTRFYSNNTEIYLEDILNSGVIRDKEDLDILKELNLKQGPDTRMYFNITERAEHMGGEISFQLRMSPTVNKIGTDATIVTNLTGSDISKITGNVEEQLYNFISDSSMTRSVIQNILYLKIDTELAHCKALYCSVHTLARYDSLPGLGLDMRLGSKELYLVGLIDEKMGVLYSDVYNHTHAGWNGIEDISPLCLLKDIHSKDSNKNPIRIITGDVPIKYVREEVAKKVKQYYSLNKDIKANSMTDDEMDDFQARFVEAGIDLYCSNKNLPTPTEFECEDRITLPFSELEIVFGFIAYGIKYPLTLVKQNINDLSSSAWMHFQRDKSTKEGYDIATKSPLFKSRREKMKILGEDAVNDNMKSVRVVVSKDGLEVEIKLETPLLDGYQHIGRGLRGKDCTAFENTFGRDNLSIDDIVKISYGKKVLYEKA